MGADDDGVYEFGPFRLDIADRLLWRDGTMVPLEPTQFQVLTILVREAGHLVTREHLMNRVWKETYVDEGSLTVTISILRRKLGDTPSNSTYIETVRKSGYRFVAPVTRQSGPEGDARPNPSRARVQSLAIARSPRVRRTLTTVATAALIAVITGWYWSRSEAVHHGTPAPVPLHPFGGVQEDPSFSPDGEQVVFTWRPPDTHNYDIYVLRVGDLQATRLTSDPAWDMSPVWSPDGRRIAFIRRQVSSGEILLMSPAGGPEQKVVDTTGTAVAWSPDSQTLAFIDRAAGEEVHSIFVVSAAGGPKRQVTFPAAEKMYGDSAPAISPDGRTLAFVRHLTYDVSDVFVQPLDAVKPRRLTFDKRQIRGLAWMPNGRELIFSSNRNGRHELWRLDVNGTAPPTLVDGIADARFPVVARARSSSYSRLVYQSFVEDYNIRILRRGADRGWSASQPAMFGASIRDEQSPSLSPDSRHLSFVSDRSGWFEVWVCAYPEGSDCRQLTSFRQGYVGSPRWSPDSQRIAFDARVDGNADVYLVRADVGQPVRLTHDVSVESRPAWSNDGRWIYFRSDRTGTHQIWKVPVSGGAPRHVTRNGGYEALETPDGKSLYFVQARYAKGLWSVPVDGGPEVRLPGFESLTASSWTIINTGVMWVDTTISNPPGFIRRYDFATRDVLTIAEIHRALLIPSTGFYAVPDGSAVMWSQLDRNAHDLMLLERFK